MTHTNSKADAEEIIKAHLDRLLSSRQYPKTICPSEVARALSSDEREMAHVSEWRELMPTIREVLWKMRSCGEVEILQKGEPLPEGSELQDVKGPIRARKRLQDSSSSQS